MICQHCEQPLLTSRQKKFCSKKCQRKAAHDRNYQKHKEQYTKRRIKWKTENPLRTKYLYARADTKRRGRGGFHIEYEDCTRLWNLGCTYCAKEVLSEKGCSLDRLDNNLGYTLDNVVTCCGDCNTVRSDILSHEEMKVAMAAIIAFRKSNV